MECKIKLCVNILVKLQPHSTYKALFLQSFFRRWLDVHDNMKRELLLMTCSSKEPTIASRNIMEEMFFQLHEYEILFGTREVCFITGLMSCDYLPPTLSDRELQKQVFTLVKGTDSVKL